MTIRVTVTDVENGETETRDIDNDSILITAGNHYLAGVQQHSNGTVIYTVKVAAA